ncbi:hypothetical protein ACFLZZ_00510 [Nanoarchaeota archaeon]
MVKIYKPSKKEVMKNYPRGLPKDFRLDELSHASRIASTLSEELGSLRDKKILQIGCGHEGKITKKLNCDEEREPYMWAPWVSRILALNGAKVTGIDYFPSKFGVNEEPYHHIIADVVKQDISDIVGPERRHDAVLIDRSFLNSPLLNGLLLELPDYSVEGIKKEELSRYNELIFKHLSEKDSKRIKEEWLPNYNGVFFKHLSKEAGKILKSGGRYMVSNVSCGYEIEKDFKEVSQFSDIRRTFCGPISYVLGNRK